MDKEKRVILKNIVITLLVIFMFVGIILAFYRMLYAEKRNSILKEGKTAAERTADDVNDYLSTSIDAIKLSAYTLEGMIRDNHSHVEIQDYLEGQSNAVTSTVFENTTGVYGYIDGQYHDGSGWIPDEGYFPTERPWYLKAIQKPGAVVLVDPYVDAETNNVMMSLAKVLSDGQSVVAMDIYLDKLQEITENAIKSDGADIEFILDSQNMVIAHSDEKEVGRKYSDDDSSIGGEIVKMIDSSNDDFFELQYNGIHYIIYTVTIENDWKCISVENASSVFDPLRIILVLTIAAVLVVIFTISVLMMNSSKKTLLAEKLSSQLSSTADIYVSLYEIDFLKNTMIEVRDSDQKVSSGTEKPVIGNNQAQLVKMMEEYSDESSRKDILDFVNFTSLDHRIRGKNTITLEFLNKNKKWCRARFIVSERMADGRVTCVMFLIEDIDDERKERDELINMSERAMAANKAKSSFLSNMSHEIRTPINAVLGMNEMILRESHDDVITSYAYKIKTAGNSLLGLINDILDFSKIEAGKMEIIPVDYDLSSLISDLVNMVQVRADAKGLMLALDINPELPKLLHGDEVRIKQVITNMLTNAVKYTDKGMVTFGMSFEKDPEIPNLITLNVSVKDTGKGIKPEDMKKLFLEFERIEEDKNRHIEGTGLGMNIIRSLLEMMGSSLDVESIYGLGSRFSFKLHQKVLNWEPLGDYEKAYRNTLAKHSSYKEKFIAPNAIVLMVDDNDMNLAVFQSLLKQTRVETDMAMSGDECLVKTQDTKYDIIFLDHMMPGKDGIQILKELKNDPDNPNHDTPVICLTANAISGARDEYIAAGFDDYLTKPVDPDSLESMLMEYLPKELIEMPEDENAQENSASEVKTAERTARIPTEEILDDIVTDGSSTGEKADANTTAIPKEQPTDEKEKIPEALLALADQGILDISEGIRNNASVETYLMVLKMYCTSLDEKLDLLNEYLANEHFDDYTIKVHALKSSLKLIGANNISEFAQNLEDAGKTENYDYIKEHHTELVEKCNALKAQLSQVVG